MLFKFAGLKKKKWFLNVAFFFPVFFLNNANLQHKNRF